MDDTMVELHATVKAETTVADSAVSSDSLCLTLLFILSSARV